MIFQPFDWSGTAPRKTFWIMLLIFVALILALEFFLPQFPTYAWVLILLVALFSFPLWSVVVRRLHDMGRSGAWGVLMAIPIVQFGAILWLGLSKSKQDQEQPWPNKTRHRIAQALLLLMIPLALFRAFWAPYWAPSGSMKPTLLVGDYFYAALKADTPERGDIRVFTHPGNGTIYIKRVIALGGDTVQMIDGELVLNRTPVAREKIDDFEEVKAPQGPMGQIPRCANAPVVFRGECLMQRYLETLPNGASYQILDIGNSPGDNTKLLEVPEGHVFVLGDNRDNSLDSRFPAQLGGLGFVPIENLQGKVTRVLFSSAGSAIEAFWTWRRDTR